MNFNLHYKGQTISVNCDESATMKSIYDACLHKFKQHLIQELFFHDYNVKLRLKRNNIYLEWKEKANLVLQENDTIIIEPKDNLTNHGHSSKNNNISIHGDNISRIELKRSDQVTEQSLSSIKSQSKSKIESESASKFHKCQKKDQSQNQLKENHALTKSFDRNGLRRSLGAAFAPQFEKHSLTKFDNFFESYVSNSHKKEQYSSDSTISELKKKSKRKNSRIFGTQNNIVLSKSAPSSPSKSTHRFRSPQKYLTVMNTHNVRKIGKKISLSIYKKPNIGLGFTIVTRDNQVMYGSGTDIANAVVILVNKILKNGGAADDGRLQPGDRILEVNSVPVTSLKDTTDKLRTVPEDTSVTLLISRIENNEIATESCLKPKNKQSQLSLEISLSARNNENQQLGLNIHYRNDKDNPCLGPGIYIHSILSQSLAAKQGAFEVNDKLVGLNGQSLNNLDVEATINLLKKSMDNNLELKFTVLRQSQSQSFKSADDMGHKLELGQPKQYGMANKIVDENKSRKQKFRQEVKSSILNNSYSSSDSSQYDTDSHYKRLSNAFEREGKGRRSMSEKGKVHEDASKYKFYKDTRDSNNPNTGKPIVIERAYSTLPTTSHEKRLQDQSPPPLPTKAPTKPSQIKIKNVKESVPKSENGTPNRSISLRDYSYKFSVPHKSQSPKHFIPTPSNEQPIFNRAMNNSFKKAVQNFNEHRKLNQLNRSSTHNQSEIFTTSEKQYKIGNPIHKKHHSVASANVPRPESIKNSVKNKLSNKDILNFSRNMKGSEKTDIFPPDKLTDPKLPNYQSINAIELTTHGPYNSAELPPEFQYCNDQTILDSAKRVMEWQKKNADAICEEKKAKDNRIYQTLSSQKSTDTRINKKRKSKLLFNISLLTCCSAPASMKTRENSQYMNNKKTVHSNNYETQPVEAINGTISSPTDPSKRKSSTGQSRHTNSVIYGCTERLSPTKNQTLLYSNGVIPYQTKNGSRRTTVPNNDIYATVNKQQNFKKENNHKHSLTSSHIHKNKLNF